MTSLAAAREIAALKARIVELERELATQRELTQLALGDLGEAVTDRNTAVEQLREAAYRAGRRSRP